MLSLCYRCVTISSLAFSASNVYLAASSNTETVHIFKLEKKEERYIYYNLLYKRQMPYVILLKFILIVCYKVSCCYMTHSTQSTCRFSVMGRFVGCAGFVCVSLGSNFFEERGGWLELRCNCCTSGDRNGLVLDF